MSSNSYAASGALLTYMKKSNVLEVGSSDLSCAPGQTSRKDMEASRFDVPTHAVLQSFLDDIGTINFCLPLSHDNEIKSMVVFATLSSYDPKAFSLLSRYFESTFSTKPKTIILVLIGDGLVKPITFTVHVHSCLNGVSESEAGEVIICNDKIHLRDLIKEVIFPAPSIMLVHPGCSDICSIVEAPPHSFWSVSGNLAVIYAPLTECDHDVAVLFSVFSHPRLLAHRAVIAATMYTPVDDPPNDIMGRIKFINNFLRGSSAVNGRCFDCEWLSSQMKIILNKITPKARVRDVSPTLPGFEGGNTRFSAAFLEYMNV